jgi:PAS domain S-box-containing protein
MDERLWNILLVDDDLDDYTLTRAWLSEARGVQFHLQWVSNYDAALQALGENTYDAVLVDYDLGVRSGLELIGELIFRGSDIPFIMLTGRGGFEVDVEAMRAGAVDYLSKNDANPLLLERSIRYAIERKRAEVALRKARDELDLRVRERTLELLQANQELYQTNEQLRKTEEQIRRFAERSTALADLSKDLAEAGSNYARLLEIICQRVSQLFGDPSAITLFTADGQYLRAVASYHPDSEADDLLKSIYQSIQYRLDEGISGKVAQSGQAILLSVNLEDQAPAKIHPAFRPYQERYGMHSVLEVPLRIQSQVVGTLGIARGRPGEAYTPEDQAFMQSMADRAAVALENARLFVALQAELGERKRAEEALREREIRLNLVLEGIPAILWTVDRDLRFVSYTGKGLAMIGLSPDQLIGMDLLEFSERMVTPVSPTISAHQRALLGEASSYDSTVQGRHYQSHVEPFRDAKGEIIGVIGIALDITERVKDQEKLAYHAWLLENVNDAIIATDENYRLTAWNKAAEAIYGWKPEEVIGRDATEVLHTRYIGSEREDGLRRLKETGVLNGEFSQQTKAGQQIFVEAKIIALLDEAGRTAGYVAVNRDITRRKEQDDENARLFEALQIELAERKLAEDRREEAESTLRSSEARFRAIFEGSATGIELRDLDGRILAANPALQEILGYTEPELRQMADKDITHPEDAPYNVALFDSLINGRLEGYRSEKRYLHKSGSVVWARLAVSLVRDHYGIPQFAVVMIENISERKQMEAQLDEVRRRLIHSRESERLTLAQELHDGPIQELYGITYSIAATLPDVVPEELVGDFHQIKAKIEAVIRILRIISGELRPPTLAPFGLEKTILSHAETFQLEHPEIGLELDLQPDAQALPEPVRLALFRIYQQSLVNVVRHAQATHVNVTFRFDGQQARLGVQDNGRGFAVPEGWIDFVRQGHFGLAGSAERAEAVGGRLSVESQPGHGTRIEVEVPLVKQGSAGEAASLAVIHY